jgi:subtilisin family serine protease
MSDMLPNVAHSLSSRFLVWICLLSMAVPFSAEGGDSTPEVGNVKRGSPGTLDWSGDYAPNALLVGFAPQKSATERDAVSAALDCKVVHRYKHIAVDLVCPLKDSDLAATAEAFVQREETSFVELNYKVDEASIPNDPLFADQWGLHNTGQGGGKPGADIHALEAWDIVTGSNVVVVGVVDSGIDYLHEELAGTMWTNEAELNGSPGIDDDGNGVVDDIYGARWTNGDGTVTSGDPMDGHGHGTHCAGTINAVRGNAVGVAGISPSVRFMALRFKDDNNNGTVADAMAAIEYAIDKRARFTNNSYRFKPYSQAFKEVIEAAGAAGQLFITVSANASEDNDVTPSYPCAFDCDNIVGVAASDGVDGKAAFSNWGPSTVDLAAPGVDIISLEPGNRYTRMSGSSMSAAHVSGVAALLLAQYPQATCAMVKHWILDSVDLIPDWTGLTVTGGRLNAAGALMLAIRDTKPTADFTADPTSGTVPLQVSFTDRSISGSSEIIEWHWEFGDGGTDVGQSNPVHTYEVEGTYTVSLTVVSADGIDTATRPACVRAYRERLSLDGPGVALIKAIVLALLAAFLLRRHLNGGNGALHGKRRT